MLRLDVKLGESTMDELLESMSALNSLTFDLDLLFFFECLD